MVTKVIAPAIQDAVSTGFASRVLLNDSKRAINELVEERLVEGNGNNFFRITTQNASGNEIDQAFTVQLIV